MYIICWHIPALIIYISFTQSKVEFLTKVVSMMLVCEDNLEDSTNPIKLKGKYKMVAKWSKCPPNVGYLWNHNEMVV